MSEPFDRRSRPRGSWRRSKPRCRRQPIRARRSGCTAPPCLRGWCCCWWWWPPSGSSRGRRGRRRSPGCRSRPGVRARAASAPAGDQRARCALLGAGGDAGWADRRDLALCRRSMGRPCPGARHARDAPDPDRTRRVETGCPADGAGQSSRLVSRTGRCRRLVADHGRNRLLSVRATAGLRPATRPARAIHSAAFLCLHLQSAGNEGAVHRRRHDRRLGLATDGLACPVLAALVDG